MAAWVFWLKYIRACFAAFAASAFSSGVSSASFTSSAVGWTTGTCGSLDVATVSGVATTIAFDFLGAFAAFGALFFLAGLALILTAAAVLMTQPLPFLRRRK